MNSPLSAITPSQLAAQFSELLRKELGNRKMAKVISRNVREIDKNICHSHDFCDANMVMDEAFKQLCGRSATDTGNGGHDCQQSGGCMSDEALHLWNAAWAIAKACDFKVAKDPRTDASVSLPLNLTCSLCGLKLQATKRDLAEKLLAAHIPLHL